MEAIIGCLERLIKILNQASPTIAIAISVFALLNTNRIAKHQAKLQLFKNRLEVNKHIHTMFAQISTFVKNTKVSKNDTEQITSTWMCNMANIVFNPIYSQQYKIYDEIINIYREVENGKISEDKIYSECESYYDDFVKNTIGNFVLKDTLNREVALLFSKEIQEPIIDLIDKYCVFSVIFPSFDKENFKENIKDFEEIIEKFNNKNILDKLDKETLDNNSAKLSNLFFRVKKIVYRILSIGK